jgi:hypothetical protein
LSASKFAHLVVSRAPSTVAQPPPAARDLSERPTTSRTSDKDGEAWDVILFVGHFAADGLALHALADAFFALAFGPASVDEAEAVDAGTVRSVMQLERLLQRETLARLEVRSASVPNLVPVRRAAVDIASSSCGLVRPGQHPSRRRRTSG